MAGVLVAEGAHEFRSVTTTRATLIMSAKLNEVSLMR